MVNKLVIVESPGKIKKITEYLGNDFMVKASFGHCLDLDSKTLSIDVENNFNPIYVICEGKHKLVKELKTLGKNYEVILAADEDREGEAIAHSLKNILDLKNPKRIVFHEITKKAITHAIENPREIDMNMVYAQQARRLLDRLVGYKISPILWKNMNSNTVQSAGRVQSVVLKIINDKEEEIKNSVNSPYFKSSVILNYKKNKIYGILSLSDNNIYKFENTNLAKTFLEKINDKTIFKVIDIQNKISIRKPSPPFITSTLQQEASTKLRFGVQKTMQVAQKLYESGLITYMRTDSTCLSNDAINNCKDYIIKNFGKKYSKPNPYSINKEGSQEAHEAIRPTNVNLEFPENLDKDCKKLYELILNRTLASQMSPAEIDIKILKIDTLNDNKSILISIKAYWISTTETILFDGFLKIYNDNNNDEDDNKDSMENNNLKDLDILVDSQLNFDGIKVTEEYTKLPLRYNEANLVKYLEKNSIGRPSTYASIIHKVLERQYVEIKNIDGIKKDSKIIELNKKYQIKEIVKEVILGKETKKIVPTDLGIKVNQFMHENFLPIIQIEFTAEFEKYLDMIAEGKAKWYNILDKFYKMFNPIVIQLSNIPTIKNNIDAPIMKHPDTNQDIYIGSGKYGPYIKFDENGKARYVSIPNKEITPEEIIELIKYPRLLGTFKKKNIYLLNGKFGYYIKYGDKNISFNQEDIDKVDEEYCKNLLESGDKYALNTFKIKDTTINVKDGQYGPYLQLLNSKNKIIKNISIPKSIDSKNITIVEIINIIEKN